MISRLLTRLSARHFALWLIAAAIGAMAWSCSSTKHVAPGSYLVDKVSIDFVDTTGRSGSRVEGASSSELINYLRQTPNHRVLGFWKLQLSTYNLSGRDSTKWWNRWLRSLGQAPVVFDSTLTELSARQLQLAMENKGYLDAKVDIDTIIHSKKRKIEVNYHITPGEPRRIASIDYAIADSAIRRIVEHDSVGYNVHVGDLLDLGSLDAMRSDIALRLHNRGYYDFTKDNVTFTADTVEGSPLVDLTLYIAPRASSPRASASADTTAADHQFPFRRYYINKVYIMLQGQSSTLTREQMLALPAEDWKMHRGISFIFGDPADHYLHPATIEEKCYLQPGQLYRENNVNLTYQSLAQLGILRTVNIETRVVTPASSAGEGGQPGRLDVYIMLTRNPKQSLTLELEGTNSEGDLGIGAGLTYQHRNLGHRSTLFTAKGRASYESLSGNLDGFINDRYSEYAGEVSLTFPRFEFPLLSRSFKRRVKASSEVALSFNYQERPEYTRIIAGAAWKYKWQDRRRRRTRLFDLLDINYVYLPRSTTDFINQIAPDNPLLRYSYEDHFIMRTGFTYTLTNKAIPTSSAAPGATAASRLQPTVYRLRASIETAGNLLYGLSHLLGSHREDGAFKVFGVPYSQYAKAEFDYSVTRNFTPRHSLAFRVATGVAVPYGNSDVVPFEKRFYAGGASGVRGWAVRTLGPGSYNSRNAVTSFINQCGDIRLDLSLEYRAKLVWVIEAGAFIDAGNIWTIHSYPNQPGGQFRCPEFLSQIAWAYGIGLRLDFTYFLFRLDLGIKAYNPAEGQERWPLIHPRWHRDTTFHFSVGYPF